MSHAERLSLLAAKLKERGRGREGSQDGGIPEISFCLETHHVIAQPKSTEEVVDCMEAARATGCSVSVVGGNHSGYGRSGDFVLEMSHFASVEVEDRENTIGKMEPTIVQQKEQVEERSEMQREEKSNETTETASQRREIHKALLRVGGGVTLKQVSVEAQQHDLAVPLGTAPTVGLGLILQGGVGHLTRSLGLAVDAIHSMQLVTAKAEVVNVSRDSPEAEIQELFWAAAGCGPNFGVVTSVTLEAAPFRLCDSNRQVFHLPADSELSCTSLQKYLSWSSALPLDCSADCCLYFKDNTAIEIGDSTSNILMGIYTYDFGCGSSFSSQFDLFGPTVLFDKFREKHGAAEVMDHEPYLCEQPEGTVHKGFVEKRSFFVRALFFKKNADISKEVVAAMQSAPSAHCYFQFQHMGGVVSENTGSVFAAREAEWSLVISGAWSEEKSAGPCRSWVMQVVKELLPKALGSYATDLGPGDEALALHSFGHNTKQLVKLKKRWDPENMFKHGFPLTGLEG